MNGHGGACSRRRRRRRRPAVCSSSVAGTGECAAAEALAGDALGRSRHRPWVCIGPRCGATSLTAASPPTGSATAHPRQRCGGLRPSPAHPHCGQRVSATLPTAQTKHHGEVLAPVAGAELEHEPEAVGGAGIALDSSEGRPRPGPPPTTATTTPPPKQQGLRQGTGGPRQDAGHHGEQQRLREQLAAVRATRPVDRQLERDLSDRW
jgi:hypothetical protein